MPPPQLEVLLCFRAGWLFPEPELHTWCDHRIEQLKSRLFGGNLGCMGPAAVVKFSYFPVSPRVWTTPFLKAGFSAVGVQIRGFCWNNRTSAGDGDLEAASLPKLVVLVDWT